MPERVKVGETIYPTFDAGISGITPGLEITNKVTGETLLARTTTGMEESPSGGGSYDYTTGYAVPGGVPAFKAAWDLGSAGIVYTEDYMVDGQDTSTFTMHSTPWPVGTSVSAYPASSVSPNDISGTPIGSAAATATVAADGSVTFTGLPSGGYVAQAVITGKRTAVRFYVD